MCKNMHPHRDSNPDSLWSISLVGGTGNGKRRFFKTPLILTWKYSLLPRYLSVKGWVLPDFHPVIQCICLLHHID